MLAAIIFLSFIDVLGALPNGKYQLSIPFQQSCALVYELYQGDTFFFDIQGNSCVLITDNSATGDSRLHATCVGTGTYNSATKEFAVVAERTCWTTCCADAGFSGTFTSNGIADFRWIVKYTGVCVCGSYEVDIPIPGVVSLIYETPASCQDTHWLVSGGGCVSEKPFGTYCISGTFQEMDTYCRIAGGYLCSKDDLASFQPTCGATTVWVTPSCSMNWATRATNCQALPTTSYGAYCCSRFLTSSPSSHPSQTPTFLPTSAPSPPPSAMPTRTPSQTPPQTPTLGPTFTQVPTTTNAPSFAPSTPQPTLTRSPTSLHFTYSPTHVSLFPTHSPSLRPSSPLPPTQSPTYYSNVTHGDVVVDVPCEVDPITHRILHPCELDPSGTGTLNVSGGHGSINEPITIVLIVNGSEVVVKNLSVPVVIVMTWNDQEAARSNCGIAPPESSLRCVSRGSTDSEWTESGCKVVIFSNRRLTCACTHFTDFAAMAHSEYSCSPDPVYYVFATCFALLGTYCLVILVLLLRLNSAASRSFQRTMIKRHLVVMCAAFARFGSCLVFILQTENRVLRAIFGALPYQLEGCMFTILVSEWSVIVYFSMGASRAWAGPIKKIFVACNFCIFVCITLLFASYSLLDGQTLAFLGSLGISAIFLVMAAAFWISARNVVKFAVEVSKSRQHTCGLQGRIRLVGNLVASCLVMEAVFDCVAYIIVSDRRIVEASRATSLSFLTAAFLLMALTTQFLVLFLYSKGAHDMISKHASEEQKTPLMTRSSNRPAGGL